MKEEQGTKCAIQSTLQFDTFDTKLLLNGEIRLPYINSSTFGSIHLALNKYILLLYKNSLLLNQVLFVIRTHEPPLEPPPEPPCVQM